MSQRTREYQERIRGQVRSTFHTNHNLQSPALIEQDLAARGARFTPLELRLPDTLDLDGWAEIGRRLTRADQVMQWWLGDWAAFGLRKFEGVTEGMQTAECRTQKWEQKPRRGALKEFAEANGINYQTLRNLAWVSNKVALSRRRDRVEWSKHSEVAALPAREQAKWLSKAESEHLSQSALRQQIRLSQGEENALASDGPVLESGSKHLDALLGWLNARPEGFWTEERKAVWREKFQPLARILADLFEPR